MAYVISWHLWKKMAVVPSLVFGYGRAARGAWDYPRRFWFPVPRISLPDHGQKVSNSMSLDGLCHQRCREPVGIGHCARTRLARCLWIGVSLKCGGICWCYSATAAFGECGKRIGMNVQDDARVNYPAAIRARGISIYELIPHADVSLWIPSAELQAVLEDGLRGMSVEGMALRTRSKKVKQRICSALGYPKPASFKRTSPTFPGQRFDVYVQKSDNLQVWNREISNDLRYVLVRVGVDDRVSEVKVVTGDVLSRLDTTGTLTQKYQARLDLGDSVAELVSPSDTSVLVPFVTNGAVDLSNADPAGVPTAEQLLSIEALFDRLSPFVGEVFEDAGRDQERNRGAVVHRSVCEVLGYGAYRDGGQFPDVRHQLLEVKLQTSPTIDLGKVSPSSTAPLDGVGIRGVQVRHCDVRYAIFYGTTDGERVSVTHVFVVNGENFYSRFSQFGGNVVNRKIQLRLPVGFFNG